MAMTEAEIEREQMACVFVLGGGELHKPEPDFPDEWDGKIAYWYEGTPCHATDLDVPACECRTAILYGAPLDLDGWEFVAQIATHGERECWWCGPGTDWDGSDGQVLAKHHNPGGTNTGYQGNPDCPLCEGSGHVYIGEGWSETIYCREEG